MTGTTREATAAALGEANLAGIEPIGRTTLGEQAYDRLREFLMSGQIRPGDRLTLRQLAAALGTSVMPVRDAVRQLAAGGALHVEPNRAVRVPLMTRSRFREVLRIRMELEGVAVQEATARIAPAAIDEMARLNRDFEVEMRDPDGDDARLFRLNKSFHFTAYEAAGMPVLLGLIETLWLQYGPVLHFSLRRQVGGHASNPAPGWHDRLIAAFRDREARAARAAIVGDLESTAERIVADGKLSD